MRIAVAGGTGFIGKALTKALMKRGDAVTVITRSKPSDAAASAYTPSYLTWDELRDSVQALEGIDAVINLSGESINQRWTGEAKKRILESRIQAAERTASIVHRLETKPEAVINASGISAYGISDSRVFDESSPTAVTDFLSGVVREWEAAADCIHGTRLVKIRTGVVLDAKEGAFPLMALPYRLFGGGRIGSGKQGLSWIHLEDMVGLLLFCLDHKTMEGPVNASAPDPVSNDGFGRAVAKAMNRPHWFPVPSFLMRAVFGEMSTLLLDGQRALPKKAMEHGFEFRYPSVDSAMRQLVGKN
nr:TIGR01777 family oxidoreductase [Paenibacillus sp. HB172176]